jgi:uncharacterized protein YpmB
MVKITYIITGVAIVIVLAILGAVAYYHPGSSNTPVSTPMAAANETNGMITAFGALSMSDSDTDIISWKASNKNGSVAEISSDFCTDGLSDTWAVTYASDTGEATVHIANATIIGVTTLDTSESTFPYQKLMTDKLMDSNVACGIASKYITDNGEVINGEASVTLTLKASGAPIWDMNYPVMTGYYILRIDASSGKVTETARYRG